MAPLERAIVVSYRLSIVTVALSVTKLAFCHAFIKRILIDDDGHNLRLNVSDAQINRGWVTLGQNLGCSPWTRPVMLGLQRVNIPG